MCIFHKGEIFCLKLKTLIKVLYYLQLGFGWRCIRKGWLKHMSSSQSIQIIRHVVLYVVIKGIKQLEACSFGNRDWWKAGTMKTGHTSSSNNESSAQLESKAARSVNASPMCFSHYRNSTGVKAQEGIMHTRRKN